MLNVIIHSIGGIESAVHICRYLSHSAHLTVQEQLEKIDVLDKLQYTQSVLRQIRSNFQQHQQTQPNHPIVVATTAVLDSLNYIRRDLRDIHKLHNAHHERWFHQWYNPNCTHPLEQLKQHVCVLDLRMRRLLDILPLMDTFLDDAPEPNTPIASVRRHSI